MRAERRHAAQSRLWEPSLGKSHPQPRHARQTAQASRSARFRAAASERRRPARARAAVLELVIIVTSNPVRNCFLGSPAPCREPSRAEFMRSSRVMTSSPVGRFALAGRNSLACSGLSSGPDPCSHAVRTAGTTSFRLELVHRRQPRLAGSDLTSAHSSPPALRLCSSGNGR